MFRRISILFTNQPVGRKLAIGFGLLVFLALIIGGAAFVSSNLSGAAADEFVQTSDEMNLLALMDGEMLEARRAEKDFFLRYRAQGYDSAYNNYVVKYREHMTNYFNAIAEYRAMLPGSDTERAQILDTLEQHGHEYQDTFEKAVTDLEQYGTDSGSGAVALALDSYAKLAEDAAAQGDTRTVVASYQTLDLIWSYLSFTTPGAHTGEIQEVEVEHQNRLDAIDASNNEIRRAIDASDLTSDEKAALRTDLDTAATNFQAVATLEGDLEQNIIAARDAAETIHPLIDETTQTELAANKARDESWARLRNGITVGQSVMLALAAVIGVAASIILMRLITRQVAEIDRVFRAVGVGDFDARAHIFSTDEIGRTADGVNAMLARFVEMLTEAESNRMTLQQAVDRLVQEVSELAAGNLAVHAEVQQGAATEPVAEALNYAVGELRNLVDGVEDAAAQMTTASTTITDVVSLMANQASSSAQAAERASQSAKEGSQVVDATVAAMSRIRENTQESARRMKRLGEASQEITEVVRLIEELSDRTTVLALNASIQAAAAGEAGRGFAVVAEEVQRLAERATAATRQIENLVKGIQAETNEAAVGIEEATREVVEGSQLAQVAGQRMAELNQTVADLATLIEHVATNTSQQTEESVANLVALSNNLQQSVSAFRAERTGNGRRAAYSN